MISAAKYRIITEMNDLTSDTEQKITDANAWASIIRTGAVKPTEGEIGALIPHTWKNMMDEVDVRIAKQQAIFKKELDVERQEREQADLIIASQVAKINNLLREKDIIQTERDRLDDAHSILHYCQVCFERARDIRFDPCGHVVCCGQCGQEILNSISQGRRCPICRLPITRMQNVYMA
jgi:hypothetical protein